MRAVVQQADGQIIFAGSNIASVGGFPRGIARISATGLLDQTFDVLTSAGIVYALAIDGQGLDVGYDASLYFNGSNIANQIVRNKVVRIGLSPVTCA